MRSARLHAIGDVRVEQEDVPLPTDGESLVRMTAVGLCGSDLHWFAEGGIGDARLAVPLVLGHEMAGVVQGGPLDGRRVAVDPADSCGACDQCRRGYRNLCPTVRFAGHATYSRSPREYVAWPTALLYPVPDAVSDAGAAMLEPLGVALHAMDLARLRIGATVVVVGCGPIGLCVVQLARLGGAAQVVAVEPLAHRRAAAAAMGADVVLDPGADDLVARLGAATGGRGADVVLEVAGTDDAVTLAVEAARPGARVVLAGIPASDSTTFPASVARRKGLTLSLVRRMNDTYPRTISLVERGAVDVASVVSDTFPLARVAEAFATAERRTGLKVIVEPGA